LAEIKKRILVVDGDDVLRNSFVREINHQLPDYKTSSANNLKDAHEFLQAHEFLAMIVGKDFADFKKNEKEQFDVTTYGYIKSKDSAVDPGLQLIEKIRKGNFGDKNAKIPIFFQDQSMWCNKLEDRAHKFGGFTQCYVKTNLQVSDLIADVAGQISEPYETPMKWADLFEIKNLSTEKCKSDLKPYLVADTDITLLGTAKRICADIGRKLGF